MKREANGRRKMVASYRLIVLNGRKGRQKIKDTEELET